MHLNLNNWCRTRGHMRKVSISGTQKESLKRKNTLIARLDDKSWRPFQIPLCLFNKSIIWSNFYSIQNSVCDLCILISLRNWNGKFLLTEISYQQNIQIPVLILKEKLLLNTDTCNLLKCSVTVLIEKYT